jgi:hypothetical protein
MHQLTTRLVKRAKQTTLIVALLGAGGQQLAQRRTIAGSLSARGILALIPEDDFPKDVGASLLEEAMLSKGDVGLVFVNVESWGSVIEFAELRRNPKIAPKLRVIVNHAYHPLYGSSTSYLTDVYLTHMAVFGHVYAVDGPGGLPFPSTEKAITILAERFRQLKARI